MSGKMSGMRCGAGRARGGADLPRDMPRLRLLQGYPPYHHSKASLSTRCLYLVTSGLAGAPPMSCLRGFLDRQPTVGVRAAHAPGGFRLRRHGLFPDHVPWGAQEIIFLRIRGSPEAPFSAAKQGKCGARRHLAMRGACDATFAAPAQPWPPSRCKGAAGGCQGAGESPSPYFPSRGGWCFPGSRSRGKRRRWNASRVRRGVAPGGRTLILLKNLGRHSTGQIP